jgi:hypothetical protein
MYCLDEQLLFRLAMQLLCSSVKTACVAFSLNFKRVKVCADAVWVLCALVCALSMPCAYMVCACALIA